MLKGQKFHFVTALTLLLLVTLSSEKSPHHIKSVELAFTDASPISGLGIIPASCPSSPDYPGACDATTAYCPDGSVLPASGSCAPTLSYCPDGSVKSATNDCTGAKSYCADGSVMSASNACPVYRFCPDGTIAPPTGCSKIVIEFFCPDGNRPVNGQCPSAPQCPDGYVGYNGQCVRPGCDNVFWWLEPSCASVDKTCAPPSVLVGSQCIQCPSNSTWSGFSCVVTSCPAGFDLVGGTCQKKTAVCPPQFNNVNGVCTKICALVCNGSTLINQCTKQSVTCSYGCAANICIPPPAVIVKSFQVSPSLLRRGKKTTISWDVVHSESCSVTGSNHEDWRGMSGNQNSDLILSQTIFTLHCVPIPNAVNTDGSPYIWTDEHQTVNVIPQYQER